MALSRRTIATLAVLFLVVTAGCAGSGGPDEGGDPAAGGNGGDGGNGGNGDGMAGDAEAGAPDEAEYDAGDLDDIVVQERARIKTGHVELEVDDFDETRRNLETAAEGYGGFVSDANERLHSVDNETYTTGVVVLRVPRDDFSTMMEDVRSQGTVHESDEDEEDVTEQLVDIEARVDNLRAQRDRLRALYDDANETRDILDIEERLTDVQTEIERLDARKQSLERQVALSTIRVELREPEPEPDPEPLDTDRWYDTGVTSAFLSSVDGVVATARALVVAAAYVLPYLIVFGVPIAITRFGIRRHRRRTRKIDDTAVSDDEDE